jgi:3-oxoacyl-[acyl-carrier-protein] synthase I
MSVRLSVQASGMVTALGYNAPATLAALRAGLSGVRTQAWADLGGGEPYRCARVALPQRWGGVALLADLLAPALHECLQAAALPSLAAVPLLVGVSHPSRPGRAPGIEDRLLQALAERLEVAEPHPLSRVYPAGQTGCAQALHDAHALIAAGQAQQVIVAGVDSLVDRETLVAYDTGRRLLSTGNFNGFLAGEAGSALLVGTAQAGAGSTWLTGSGLAVESAVIDGTQPLQGLGLTDAVRGALRSAGLAMADVDWRLSDLSGEHYKFKEAMFVAMRLDRAERDEPLAMWHPIEYLGEIGAAILPCLLAWAGHAMHEDYGPGRTALCHVGSDAGERAAFVLQSA